MSDYRDLLEQERRRHSMRDGSLEGLRRRQDRKRRNGQILAGVLALLIAAAGVGGGLLALRSSPGPMPADRTPTPTPTPAPGGGKTGPSQVSGPIQFIDDLHGWAVVSGHIVVTSDGGKTWGEQYAGPLEVTGLTFLDSRLGWATSPRGLLRTSDGGSHWARVGIAGVGFAEVQFQDHRTGWGIRQDLPPNAGFAGTVVKTTNGGDTWAAQSIQSDSVCFGTDGETESIWAAGEGEGGISFMRSTDGGQSWNDTPIAVPEGEPWSASLQCLGTEVWVQLQDGGAAGHTAYGVFRSVDGGPAELVLQEAGTMPFGQKDRVFESEDTYPGPFNVVAPGIAYFMNWCPACAGSLPSVSITITSGGQVTDRFPVIVGEQHGQPVGVSFLAPEGGENVIVHGWALLEIADANGSGLGVLETTDGGRTWSSPCGSPPYACFSP